MDHIHLIGIGGSGLSAIARLLIESGYIVSGSDQIHSPLTDELMTLGIKVSIGHDALNVSNADLVIRSSAIPDDNPEILASLRQDIPVYKRSEFLADFIKDQLSIAISGTHGKTTTTAMIAWTLMKMGHDPSFIIGGVSKNLKYNAHAGKSKLFVIEADEYDRMFLGLKPDIMVLTNIDYDHPDYFLSQEDYYEAFNEFIRQVEPDGKILIYQEDERAVQLSKHAHKTCKVFTYGPEHPADYQAVNLEMDANGNYSFDATFQPENQNQEILVGIHLQIPGLHNVHNALATIGVIHQLGLPVKDAGSALEKFMGTERRFDILGEFQGVTLIDDYAHHPTEIRITLEAARNRFPDNNIRVVWQPHTFSRSKTFFDDFRTVFEAADELIVTEIFAAREKEEDFSSSSLVENIQHEAKFFIPRLDEVITFLLPRLHAGDVVIVLSAGDATRINKTLSMHLENIKAA
ncbi:MAG: UDP-N-acetylmuramate--L-alanine ligase [Anaerolineaceae bacterium]|nr:UDP-N-acetylmuramate--L-alanine ligase [Anaerolineaceae bacterium]